MCRFCNIEEGNGEIIDAKNVEVIIGKRVVEHSLVVFIDNIENEYELDAEYYIDDDEAVASVRLKLNYCPFCGRELKHENEGSSFMF